MNEEPVRRRSGRRAFGTISTVVGLSAAACQGSDLPTAPSFGFVRVAINDSGGDLDADGYDIVADDSQVKSVMDNTVASFYLAAGEHTISIRKLATNCAVTGPATRTVPVVQGQTTQVTFDVVCVATGITVTLRTSGEDTPSELRLRVDDRPPLLVAANGSETIGRLTDGTHAVALAVPAHCTVAGADEVSVSVVARKLTELTFDVSCAPVVRLERIAYAADVKTGGGTTRWIELVNVDGTGAVRLQHGDSPAWSSDGIRLAFSDAECWDSFYYYDRYCVGGLVVVDPEIGDVATPAAGRSTFEPAWAPATYALALEAPSSNSPATVLVVLRPLSGTLTQILFLGVTSAEQPAWSPDGKRIAIACRFTTHTDLCVVNDDGSNPVRLSDDVEFDQHPAWSPDGRKLAFARYAVGRSDDASAEVAVMDLATRQITLLGQGTDPAWSPDGSQLIFAGLDGLFVMNADGTGRTRLTTGAHHAPAWRPR